MLFNPTLIVERLLVKHRGKIVHDENFHKGVNVIAGRNGGGKTSIIQLLVFALGYEVSGWKEEAKLCDIIYLGVNINGNNLSLRRSNNQSEKQPLEICFKPISQALQAPIEDWYNYPYAISSARESFSQKLFSILGIPEAKADANGNNITIHQVLRLIYSNQSNSSGNIFNSEPFDSAFKRESVGNYLLGIYDDDIYNSKIELAIQERVLESSIAKLQAVYSVLGKTQYTDSLGTLDQERENCLNEVSSIIEKIAIIKQEPNISYSLEKKITEDSATENIKIKSKLSECEAKIQQASFDIEDSRDFIAELQDKSVAINDSIRIGKIIPKIRFARCPSCNNIIKPPKVDDSCHLCGCTNAESTIEPGTALLRMKNEIDIQLRESEKILLKKEQQLEKIIAERKILRSDLRKNISKISSTLSSVNSSSEAEIYEGYRKIGEIEERIVSLEKLDELRKSLSTLTSDRAKAQDEVTKLKALIEGKTSQYILRTPEIKQLISNNVISILREDLGTEIEFKNATEIEFDFASNRISVNGKSTFSESGTVYLYNAFHLALFMASLIKPYVRIPRFMILDGIENGGMEDPRSKNFQEVVKRFVESYDVDCQIILATKSVSPQLNTPKYLVGPYYEEGNKSLKM